MGPGWIILIVILAVLIIAVVVLYILGRRAQKKQAEQQVQIEAHKQSMSMLIIDKKKMRMKDSGLPQYVIDQSPKLMRNSKLPIVKAKIGPQVMSLICDEKIFDSIPIRKEVKAQGFVEKPFTIPDFIATIKHHLQKATISSISETLV